MLVPFGKDPDQLQLSTAARELAACNDAIGSHGLSLSAQDVHAIVVGRADALRATERVEFGAGIAKELVLAFASSPYVSQSTFAQTIVELQELFYEFKNESLEQIPDDELIGKMRSLFDEVAGGDLGYLEEALFEGLGRAVREAPTSEGQVDDADNAVANAYTLAAHRYDVGKWVDETYAPPWEGSSWLDE
jgi:hypothetical protein